jgi:Transposase zinc-binding domain
MPCSATAPANGYRPREPSGSALYQLVADQRATFERVAAEAGGVPTFVHESFARLVRCGVLAFGFARFGCTSCGHDHLVPLSCKTRGLCPSSWSASMSR